MEDLLRMSLKSMNILTSVKGFMDLALAEPDRSTRYKYMMRAVRELNRAIKLESDKQRRIEVKATQYGEGTGTES